MPVHTTPTRRIFVLSAGAAALTPAALTAAEPFEVTRTDAQWRAMLTDTQYQVMRRQQTEQAYSSPLHDKSDPGTYLCRGCDLALYSSATKFDSGTGWPSFSGPLGNAVRTKPDNLLWISRTEIHCRRCGSHLGHLFDDGPAPTGDRHCLNGSALVFRAT